MDVTIRALRFVYSVFSPSRTMPRAAPTASFLSREAQFCCSEPTGCTQ